MSHTTFTITIITEEDDTPEMRRFLDKTLRHLDQPYTSYEDSPSTPDEVELAERWED